VRMVPPPMTRHPAAPFVAEAKSRNLPPMTPNDYSASAVALFSDTPTQGLAALKTPRP